MERRKFLQFCIATVCLQQLKFSNALERIEIVKSDSSPVEYADIFTDLTVTLCSPVAARDHSILHSLGSSSWVLS